MQVDDDTCLPIEQNRVRWVNKNCIGQDFVFTTIWKPRKLAYRNESDYIESNIFQRGTTYWKWCCK